MARTQISLAEAGQIAIRAAALDRRRSGHPGSVLRMLGSVQLDTISVLARSHELVHYARLGPIGRERVEKALWGHGRTFEYWSHAACVLPMEHFPWFAFRRRNLLASRAAWRPPKAAITRVRSALAEGGAQTATALGGARRESGWWRWSDTKEALEWLLATGEVVVTDRSAWKRVYDLSERVVPAYPHAGWVTDRGVFGPSDEDCVRALLEQSVRLMGVGTFDDVQDVHRLVRRSAAWEHVPLKYARARLAELVEGGRVQEVLIDGESWYADPTALRRVPRRSTSLTTLLSPFDPLVWHRPRLERLFGLRMRIEAYTPKHMRTHGYFAMPVLHEGRIIGMVDPAREGDALVARNVTLFEREEEGVGRALADAAQWVGRSRVVVDSAPSLASARRLARIANAALNA